MEIRGFKLFALLAVLVIVTGLAACGSDDDPTDPGGGGDDDTTAPMVWWAFPEDGMLMVLNSGTIQVEFDEPMDPINAAAEIIMSHGTLISADWVGDTSLLIQYDNWPQASWVTLALGVGFKDVAGNALKDQVVLGFGTWSDNLFLFGMTPAGGTVDVNRAAVVDLDFGAYVEESSLNAGITISDGTKANLPFTATSQDFARWILRPVDYLPADTEITVTIGTSVVSSEGTTFEEPFVFSFMTNDQIDDTPPTIVSIDPPHMGTMPANQTAITFTFSEPINPDTFKPSHMNGQLWWLIDQAVAEPTFDATFTVLTVPLPADLPAGLELEATFVDFADMVGNVQTNESKWEVDVAGQADQYPVYDGMRWFMIGNWADGDLGSELPNQTGEEWIWYQFTEGSAADQWNKEEWEDPDYTNLDFYEIQEVKSNGLYLRGIAEWNGGSFQEIMISSPITLAEFPVSAGNSWSSNASLTIPGEGTIQVETTGSVVGQTDLVVGERDGIVITWTGAWQVEFDVELFSGGTKFTTDHTDFWVVPGVGIVREMYREENSDPEEMYWHTHDRWLEIEEPEF